MKITANSTLKVLLGISAIILSAAAFNLTIAKANAAPTVQKNLIEEAASNGRYGMTMALVGAGDQAIWALTVYDTQTGKAKTYYDKESTTWGPSFTISTNPAGY